MNRILFFAALLAASLSAKAQTNIDITAALSKCFCEPKPFKYQLFPQSESLTVGDTTYTLDWATREVVVQGKVYKMQDVTKYDDAVEIEYNDMILVFLYDKKGKFLDYILER